MWPIGLNSKRDISAVATPVITIETNADGNKVTKLIGHTNGKTLLLGSLKIHRGAYAVDLEYLRAVRPSNCIMNLQTIYSLKNKKLEKIRNDVMC